MKRSTTVSIDEEVWRQAKEHGVNVSAFLENCLVDFIQTAEKDDAVALKGAIRRILATFPIPQLKKMLIGWEKRGRTLNFVSVQFFRRHCGLLIQPDLLNKALEAVKEEVDKHERDDQDGRTFEGGFDARG